jgi:serine/threonine protein kinase
VSTEHDSHLFEACWPSTFDLVNKEVRALKSLSTSNVTPKYVEDFGVALPSGGMCVYIVMEFIDGQMLESCKDVVIQQTAFKVQEAMSVLHSRGYVHQDAHTKNIMVRKDNSICIIDLGWASLFGEATSELFQKNNRSMNMPSFKGDVSKLVLYLLICLGVVKRPHNNKLLLQPETTQLLSGVLDEAKRSQNIFTPKEIFRLVTSLSIKVNSLSQVELLEATKRSQQPIKKDSQERYQTALTLVGACWLPNMVTSDLAVKSKKEVKDSFFPVCMSNKGMRCVHATHGKVVVWRRPKESRENDLLALTTLRNINDNSVVQFVDAFFCDYDALPSEADLVNNTGWWDTLLRTAPNNANPGQEAMYKSKSSKASQDDSTNSKSQGDSKSSKFKSSTQDSKSSKQDSKSGKQDSKSSKQDSKSGKQDSRSGKQDLKSGKQDSQSSHGSDKNKASKKSSVSQQETLFVVVRDVDGAKVSSLPSVHASTPRRLAKQVLARLHAKNIVVNSERDLLDDFVWDGQTCCFTYWPHLRYADDMLKEMLLTDVAKLSDSPDDGLDVRVNLVTSLLVRNKVVVY